MASLLSRQNKGCKETSLGRPLYGTFWYHLAMKLFRSVRSAFRAPLPLAHPVHDPLQKLEWYFTVPEICQDLPGRARRLRMKLIIKLFCAPCYPVFERRQSRADIFDSFHDPVDVMIGPDDRSHAVVALKPCSQNLILFLEA
jgi:hypothetical protein